jgi:hypothetical protein
MKTKTEFAWCPECKQFGRVKGHTCPPIYVVWFEGERDCVPIRASSASNAVEIFNLERPSLYKTIVVSCPSGLKKHYKVVGQTGPFPNLKQHSTE